jgi:Fic family protein
LKRGGITLRENAHGKGESVWEKLEAQHALLADLSAGHKSMLNAVKNHFRIPIVWSSNSMDGSAFNRAETKKILEDEVSVGRKPMKDLLAVVGLNKAYEHMFLLVGADRVTEEDIKEFHRLIADSFNNSREAGHYRKTRFAFRYADVRECPGPEALAWLMKDIFKKFDADRFLMHPIRFGAHCHMTLMDTLPFEEGNGRIARLVMNTVFLQKGYLPVAIDFSQKWEYSFGNSLGDEKSVGIFEDFIADLVWRTEREFLSAVESKKIVL